MIRFLRARTSGDESKDEGFSIIEVLASFTVLAIVTIGTVPLFVSGLRGSLVSKLDTGGKNLSQERFEIMRNLPFHVDVNGALVSQPANCETPSRTDPKTAGVVVCDYRDVLDTYYRSLSAASSVTTSGYVSPTGTRSSDEPAGALYRFVISPVPGFGGRFSQTIATQFLDVNRNPITPRAGYSSQRAGLDFPTTRFIGVTVTTTWQAAGLSKKFVSFTQIAEGRPAPAAVTLQARSSALRVGGSIDPLISGSTVTPRVLSMEAGISSADGALSTGASAANQARGYFAEITPGSRIDGRTKSASAPPNSTTTDDDIGEDSLSDAGTVLAYFVGSGTKNVSASINSSQPVVAGPTLTAQAIGRTKRGGGNGTLNLGFSNKPQSIMPFLDTTLHILRINEEAGGGGEHTAVGSTYLYSTAGSGHKAVSGGAATAQTIKLFPTSFAPQGVVQIRVVSARLDCTANGSGASATTDFDLIVRYWSQDTLSYQEFSIQDGGANTLPDPLVTPVNTLTATFLSSYVDSWSALSNPQTTVAGKSVTSSLNGIVSLTSRPTRAEPESTLAIKVGVLSCLAADNR